MISDALDFVRRELRAHLGVADPEVIVDSPRTLVDQDTPRGARISVVNVHEEPNFRNQVNAERRGNVAQFGEPAAHLNADLLLAFEFQDYATSLHNLSKTIEHFQRKPLFTPSTQSEPDSEPFPTTIEKLAFEMLNLNFEELNHLWGAIGAAYVPSVVYRVRLVKAQADAAAVTPELTTIQLDAALQ